MIECNVNNISKYFGEDLIFEKISFDIKTGDRIGLIGQNGCGKTTIMKIIMGQIIQSSGNITFKKGTKLGYLDQIPTYSNDTLVIDIMHSAFSNVYEKKKELDLCVESLSTLKEENLEKAMNKYTILTHEYELLDGYNIETNISKVTSGLKINNNMLNMSFNLLSGGEKTRVMLGKILLEKPSILLLDEPSNHLDLESIEWLETYLKDYEGSMLIISHDRYFLDNVCQKLIEVSQNKAHVFHGNYSYYVIEKERRFLLEMKTYLAQEKKIKRMENQIKKYRIWGTMRDSDKMFKRAKELEKRLEKIAKLDKPKKDNSKIKINNSNISRTGKRVLKVKDLSKSFNDIILLKDINLELIYQDRLAILGSNGSGKSTLIKMLLDDLSQNNQKYEWGSKLKIGYLPQEVKFPVESMTVLDYFMNEHIVSQNIARSELAKALFIKDDVLKRIEHLSGGEKSKLKLCSLTYNKVNFMILDEPTNHLDIDSREVLEELLIDFTGTILFVSHDRYFIKKIANRIAEINNSKLIFYEGDYDYYKFIKKGELKQIQPKKKKQKSYKNNVQKNNNKKIYQQIESIENEILNIEQLMEQYAFDPIKLNELYERKTILEKQYDNLFNDIK